MRIKALPSISLIAGIIFSPRKSLTQIKEGIISSQSAYVIFVIVMIYVLLKSFIMRNSKMFGVELFNQEYLNRLMSLLTDPFNYSIISYLFYFIIVFYLVKFSRFLNKGNKSKKLTPMLLSISVLGFIAQPIYILGDYLSLYNALRVFGTLMHLWNWTLIFLAVKISSSLSYGKITLLLIIPFIIIGISPLTPWSFMSSYLLFIK